MKNEHVYFIPAISEDELKSRNKTKNKRRVTAVGAGIGSALTLYVFAKIGLRIDEIVENPLVNNATNVFLGAIGTMCVLETAVCIRILKEYSQKLKEKNQEMHEKINQFFDKKEKDETQRIVEYQPNEGRDYEQFLTILKTHSDILDEKRECLKQYKVRTAYDEEDYHRDSISLIDLQNQYKSYESDLKLSRINPSVTGE